LKAKAAKTVREQVGAQRDKPNPISFVTPDGRKGRVWLGAAGVGDDRHWRVNLKELKRCGFTEPRKTTADIIRIEGNSHVPLTKLHSDPPARDPVCVQPDTWPRPWGYKVRLYIEAEEELQQLGCGWRKVIDAFKALLARNKRPKRPQLKLVVSNPPKLDERFRDVA
jgi:hypothetical protein